MATVAFANSVGISSNANTGRAGSKGSYGRSASKEEKRLVVRKRWEYDTDFDSDGQARPAESLFLRPPVSPASLKGHSGLQRLIATDPFAEDDVDENRPLAFVESSWFQSMTGAVIMANCLIIGAETDMRDTKLLWYWVEQTLLAYFVVELVLRLCHHGIYFFSPHHLTGNLLDLTIVMFGVVDMWLSPLRRWIMQEKTTKESEEIKLIIGMSRMLRVVRLVRLVRMVPPLYILAKGIMEAVQGMFWVLVFVFFILYSVSILCTRLIGHGGIMALEDMSEEAQDVSKLFGSMPASMFTLFEILSSWSLVIFIPLFEKHEILRVLAVFFYIVTAWALLAVMTGVVNEKILAVKVDFDGGDDGFRDRVKLEQATSCLHELFSKADADDSQAINREEFNAMLSHPDTDRMLRRYTTVTTADLSELFDWMDQNGDGELQLEEFLFGFYWLNEEMGPKSFLKLQQQLLKKMLRIRTKILRQIQTSFDRFFDALKDPLHKVSVITEQIQRLDVALHERAVPLKKACHGKINREELTALEGRMHKKLDLIEREVMRLETLASEGLLEFTS